MSTIQPIPINEKTIILLTDASAGEKEVTPSATSRGFVIKPDGVEVTGNVSQEKLTGKRQIVHARMDISKPCTVNGKVLENGESCWVHANQKMASCFVKLDGKDVTIDMASEGYVCIDYVTLYCFTEIKMNDKVKMKEVSCSIPVKKSTSIMMNGIPLSNKLYEMRADKHYFNKNMKFSEQMYLTHDDGSFTDIIFPTRTASVEMPGISQIISDPVTIYLKKGYRGALPFLNGIRATAQVPTVSHDGKIRVQKYTLSIQHISGEYDVNFCVIFLSEMEYVALNITKEVIHELQDSTVNYVVHGFYYKSFKEEVTKAVMVGAAPAKAMIETQETKFRPTKYLTKMIIYAADDIPVTSYIIRDVKETKRVDGGVVRELTDAHRLSDTGFVLNDTFHRSISGKVTQPIENDSRFSLYDSKTYTWTSYVRRGEIMLNDSYLFNLVDDKEREFNLRTVGNWVASENVSFQVNEKSVLPMLKLKDGEVGKELKLTIKFDNSALSSGPGAVCEKTCTIKFQIDGRTRLPVLIDDEPEFSTLYGRRASFINTTDNTFQRTWSYGRFIAPIGEPIHAYNSTVVLSKDGTCNPKLTKYPVIDHNSERSSKLVKTMSYVAEVLVDEKVITLEKDEVYMRLNVCADVEFKNSTITIKINTGTCFFSVGNTFHIYRTSTLTRNRTGGLSGNASLVGSPANSPQGTFNNPPTKPSAAPFVDSGAFSDVAVVSAAPASKQVILAAPKRREAAKAITNVAKMATTSTVDTAATIVKSLAQTTINIGNSVVDAVANVATVSVDHSTKQSAAMNRIKGLPVRSAAPTTSRVATTVAATVAVTALQNSISALQNSIAAAPIQKPPVRPYSNLGSIEYYA